MITVDRRRCAYCGGCVSVCPVEAISLAETRLLIDESCIECGDCLAACPMGASSLARASPKTTLQAMPVQSRHDLIVVGAGPGGSTAAQVAAQAGLSVLLLEKRQEIGSPVRCAEGVSRPLRFSFIEPDPLWVAAEVDKAEISAVAGGQTRTLRASDGQGYVLERRVFDRILAERAAQAGAEVRDQVRRLRHHPCLALWCGNNENQWLHQHAIPMEEQQTPVPGTLYYEDVSFLHYAKDMGRFISEFGMHASPVYETLRRCIPPEQLYHHSPAREVSTIQSV